MTYTNVASHEAHRRHRDAAFFDRVEIVGECWEWLGWRNTLGYGFIERHGRRIGAHRHAYVLAVGPIPDGLHVLHSCDNPPCVNPAHLHVGTHADNMREAIERNRIRRPHGEQHSKAKLTEAAVREIRAAHRPRTHRSVADLAERFGVRTGAIRSVVTRRTWKHVA